MAHWFEEVENKRVKAEELRKKAQSLGVMLVRYDEAQGAYVTDWLEVVRLIELLKEAGE